MEGRGTSWSELCLECELVLAALAAPARVVTISSLSESLENCSTDMKALQRGGLIQNSESASRLYTDPPSFAPRHNLS